MIATLFYLIFTAFASICILFVVGFVVRKISSIISKSQIDDYDYFSILCVGMFSVITLYSLFITSKTSNYLYLVIGAGYLLSQQRLKSFNEIRPNQEIIKSIKDVISLKFVFAIFFLIFLIFSLNSWSYFDLGNISFKGAFWDTYFYSRVSQYLNNGIENFLLEENHIISAKSMYFYHYGELWLNSFLSSVFKITSHTAYIITTSTVLLTVLSLGFFSLIDKKYGLIISILLSILFVFNFFAYKLLATHVGELTGNDYFINLYKGLGVGYSTNQQFLPKGAISYVCMFWLLRAMLKRSFVDSMFIAFILIITSPSAGIPIAISLACVIIFFKKKQSIPYLVSFFVFGCVYLFVLYVLEHSSNQLIFNNNLNFSRLSYLIDQTRLHSYTIVSILISLLPFLLFKKCRSYFISINGVSLFFILAIVASYIGLAVNILVIDYDSKQFWTYTLIPSLTLIGSYLFIVLFNTSKQLMVLVLLVLGLTVQLVYGQIFGRLPYKEYSEDYQKKVIQELGRKGKIVAVSIFNENYYGNIHTTKSTYRNLGEFIHFYRDDFVSFSLTDYLADRIIKQLGPYSKQTLSNYEKHSIFYNYMKSNGGDLYSIGYHQMNFIKKNGVQYVFVEENALVFREVSECIALLAEDTKSGERFYRINLNKE